MQGAEGDSGKSVCGLSSTVGKQMCCGEVPAAKFVDAGANVLYVDVDTSHCHFTGEPLYFPTLTAKAQHDEVLCSLLLLIYGKTFQLKGIIS